MTNTTQTRDEILASAFLARKQEVMHYQINIDNYTLALQEIAQLSPTEQADLSDFGESLKALLCSEVLEQKKSKIMLSVLQKQLEGCDVLPK